MATQPPQLGAALKSRRIALRSLCARPCASVKLCQAICSAMAVMMTFLSTKCSTLRQCRKSNADAPHSAECEQINTAIVDPLAGSYTDIPFDGPFWCIPQYDWSDPMLKKILITIVLVVVLVVGGLAIAIAMQPADFRI